MTRPTILQASTSYRSIVSCFALAILCLFAQNPELLDLVSTSFTRIVAIVSGSMACFLSAYKVSGSAFLLFRRPSGTTPWALAILGLFCFSFWNSRQGNYQDLYFDLASFIAAFALMSLWIEHKLLVKLEAGFFQPERLFGVEPGKKKRVKALEYNEHDRIELKDGDYLPVDAELLSEEARASYWMISGDQEERVFKRGDFVLQGARLIGSGSEFEVRHPYMESFYVKKLERIRDSLNQLGSVERGPARLGFLFTWVLLILALGSFYYWFAMRDSFTQGVEHFAALLCVGLPLLFHRVLIIGLYGAVIRLGRNGVILRSINAFEKVEELTGIAFDKTGTLTNGQPEVSALRTIENYSHQQLLSLAHTLESNSPHPIARAIAAKAKKESVKKLQVKELVLAEGKGLKASVERDGKSREVLVGNAVWLIEQGLEPKDFPDNLRWELEGSGDTGIWVCEDGSIVGLILLKDEIRSGVAEQIRVLKDEGYDIGLITGDAENVANSIQKTLKLNFSHFGVVPEEKVTILDRMSEKKKKGMDFLYPKYAYIGDAYSEDLALKKAHLGIAFGLRDEVIESPAEVLVLSDRLDRVRLTLDLFKSLRKRASLLAILILLYHLILVPVAAGMYYFEFSWSLNPIAGLVLAIIFSAAILSFSIRQLQD